MTTTGAVIDWMADAADFVLSVGGALLFMAAAVLFALAAWRAWSQSRRTEVIIETVDDATGDATTGAAVVGLTYRIREEVVAALPALAERARRVVQKAAESDSTSPISALMLEDIDRRETLLGDITSSQNDLMQSMEDMVPQPALGAYRVVASSLLRPKEVRVLGVLQRVNDGSGGVGLSFNVNHVGAEEAASRITLWEDEDCDVGTKTIVERFHALVGPAARALACELLRQRLRVTMSERRRHRRRARSGQHRQVDGRAVVEFLVGNSYQTAAHGSAPATKSFFRLAEQAFRKSASGLDHYKLSYQLGNTLAEQGRRQGSDRVKAIDLLSESTKLFKEANNKLPAAGLREAHHRDEELRIRAALTMNACLLAEFLSDDEEKAKGASTLVGALMTVDPADYASDGVLYSVACTLAVAARVEALAAHGVDKEMCLARAKLWLLHAGARKDLWWAHGKADPDLCLLRDWMPHARRCLWEATGGADGDTLDAAVLRAHIDKVIQALTPTPQPPAPAPQAGSGAAPGVGDAPSPRGRGATKSAVTAS